MRQRAVLDASADEKDLYRTNYEATKIAIGRAPKGEPTVAELIANRDTIGHCALEGVLDGRCAAGCPGRPPSLARYADRPRWVQSANAAAWPTTAPDASASVQTDACEIRKRAPVAEMRTPA